MDIANGIYWKEKGYFDTDLFDTETEKCTTRYDALRVFNGVYEVCNTRSTKRSRNIEKATAETILENEELEPIEYGFWSILLLDEDDTQKNECCTACAMQYPFAQIVFDQYLTSQYADFLCQKCEQVTYSPKADIYCVDCGTYYYNEDHMNNNSDCIAEGHEIEREQQIQSQSNEGKNHG